MLKLLDHGLLVLTLVHQSGGPLFEYRADHCLEIESGHALIFHARVRALVLLELVVELFDQEVVTLELYLDRRLHRHTLEPARGLAIVELFGKVLVEETLDSAFQLGIFLSVKVIENASLQTLGQKAAHLLLVERFFLSAEKK